jgi:Leucine-rich repeat (LRR) protein
MKGRFIGSIVFVLFIFSSTFVYGAIPAQEREALIALYNATQGDRWTNNSGWKTPPLHTDGFAMPGTEDSWYGITAGSNVNALHLDTNYLDGPIPPELGNLGNLTYFFLQNNQLSGPIPPELGNLSNLQEFFIFNNKLSGPIPPELGTMRILQYVRL